jgi:Ca-activated chloride channel homolog
MMVKTLPPMTDEEVRRCLPPDEAGFGSLTCEQGPLPLAAMDVQARIDGLVAQITLQQTFINTHAQPIEATYIFPLPDRAAVTRFRLEVAGRVIEGQLRERGAARREYQQAIETGHRAAITEEERPGVFTMRVGNLPPGERARVQLSLAGPLPYSDGEATFRFPLVVAPRYIPGSALPGPGVGDGVASDTDAVPDASRISPPVLLPGYPNPVRLSLRVEFASPLQPHDLRCSLHTIVEEAAGPVPRVVLQPGERLNRDFILRFRLAEERIRTGLSLQPDAGGSEGTFLLTLVPPGLGAGVTKPRDVVFVLDRSGSMEGWKIVAARRALARMVDTLSERDRFTVIAFAGGYDLPAPFGGQLVSGSDRHRFQAVEFLTRIEANGGTEMAAPLELAVSELNKDTTPGRDRILVLVTDGQVGNEDQILQHLGARARNIRIFTLGIDRAVNAAFLRRLSDLGGGASELVESEERLDEVMDQVHRHIATPLLTGLKLEPTGLKLLPGSVVPGRLPDLFAGSPLMIMGRYQGHAKGGITLQGRDAAGQPWMTTVWAMGESSPVAAGVWARARLRELEDRYVMKTSDPAGLEREIVDVSLRFGVLCRFTAFVAVDRSAVVNPGGQVQGVVQPVEEPDGWQPRGFLGAQRARQLEGFPGGVARRSPATMSGEVLCDMDLACLAESTQREGKKRKTMKSVPSDMAIKACPKSWIRRLLDMIGLGQPVDKAKQQLDPSVLQVQANDLQQAMRGCPTTLASHRLNLLRALKDRLEQLFRDLVASGETVPAVRRLGVGLQSMEVHLSAAQPSDAEINADWDEIEAALEEYLTGAGTQTPRREGFWK